MTLTDEQVADEAHMIKMEPGWPRWPLLPMKNISQEDRPVGVLVSGRLTTVYLKNLWDFESGQLGPQLEDVPTVNYESVEAMVRDGWIGD